MAGEDTNTPPPRWRRRSSTHLFSIVPLFSATFFPFLVFFFSGFHSFTENKRRAQAGPTLLAWIRGLDTNLEVRPVGGHAGPVGVPPPAEVLLLVDGRQRVAQLLVNGPHAKGTDPEGTTELLSRCSSSYPRGRDALEETRRQTALNRLKVHRAIDFSVVSCEHGQSDRAETINLRENPSRLFRPGAPFPTKGAESMEELTSRCW